MTQVRKFSEVRTTEGLVAAPDLTFGYIGVGFLRSDYTSRYGINAGHPLTLDKRARVTDGFIPGEVKVTRLKNAEGWFSLRSIGKRGDGRVVYLKGSKSVVVVDGEHLTLDEWYNTQNA